jgi:hypothetical protein
VAEIKNVGDGRWGGAIPAAKFLEEFVAGKPWVHLDIAGPAFASGKVWTIFRSPSGKKLLMTIGGYIIIHGVGCGIHKPALQTLVAHANCRAL